MTGRKAEILIVEDENIVALHIRKVLEVNGYACAGICTSGEDAIDLYNRTDSKRERDKIYAEHIHPAFDKLAENLINTGKFYYYETDFTDKTFYKGDEDS